MVDRVAGVRVPVVVRLGDDVLAHPNRCTAPATGQRAVRVFKTRLEESSHGEDLAWGHTRGIRSSSIQHLWKTFLEVIGDPRGSH